MLFFAAVRRGAEARLADTRFFEDAEAIRLFVDGEAVRFRDVVFRAAGFVRLRDADRDLPAARPLVRRLGFALRSTVLRSTSFEKRLSLSS